MVPENLYGVPPSDDRTGRNNQTYNLNTNFFKKPPTVPDAPVENLWVPEVWSGGFFLP